MYLVMKEGIIKGVENLGKELKQFLKIAGEKVIKHQVEKIKGI